MRGDDRGARERHRVKLMTAYRLHFERANLEGDRDRPLGHGSASLRLFTRVFTMQVEEGNIRLQAGARAAARSTTSASTASTPRATCSAPSRSRSSPSRANSGETALPRGRGDDQRHPALPRRAPGHLHVQLRRRRRLDVPSGGHQGRRSASSPPTNTRWSSAARLTIGGSDPRARLPEARPVRAGAPLLLGLHPEGARAGAFGLGGLGGRAHHPRAPELGADRAAGLPRAPREEAASGAVAGDAATAGPRAGTRRGPPLPRPVAEGKNAVDSTKPPLLFGSLSRVDCGARVAPELQPPLERGGSAGSGRRLPPSC